jgi:hypothetical protein
MIDESDLLTRMIRDNSEWPGGSFCVKRRPKDGEKPVGCMGYMAYGVIFRCGTPIEIHLRDYDPRRDFQTSQRYDTVDAMLADGWIVD